MIRSVPATCLTLSVALSLGACGSTRLGGFGSGGAVARGPAYNTPGPVDPVEPVPSGVVSSAPLAPPPGFDPGVPAAGAVVSDVPPPGIPAPTATPPVMASVAPPPVTAPSGRSGIVGAWTAKDASGSTCRVQLSSSPALDLYRASASGCSNRDLSRVSAWDFRDGEVYLYQPGGAVAARLRGAGPSLDGVLAKSGAPLSLSR